MRKTIDVYLKDCLIASYPVVIKRLTESPRRTVSSTGGELPGRKMDGRR